MDGIYKYNNWLHISASKVNTNKVNYYINNNSGNDKK
jgi:hypothetical protein